MDRGILVGGVLIGASFLLAVALNRSAETQTPAPTTIERPCKLAPGHGEADVPDKASSVPSGKRPPASSEATTGPSAEPHCRPTP